VPVDNGIRVAHKEVFYSQVGPADNGFHLAEFDVNGGFSAVFPWLSRIGENYEYYKVSKLQFNWRTASAATTDGCVAIAFDYDRYDSNPASVVQMCQYNDHIVGPLYGCMSLPIDVKAGKRYTELFTRNAVLTGDQDYKLHDIGTVYVAVDGVSSAREDNLLGWLEVEYEVVFTVRQYTEPTVGYGTGAVAETSGDLYFNNIGTSALPNKNPGVNYLGKYYFKQAWTGIILAKTVFTTPSLHEQVEFTLDNPLSRTTCMFYIVNYADYSTLVAYGIDAKAGDILSGHWSTGNSIGSRTYHLIPAAYEQMHYLAFASDVAEKSTLKSEENIKGKINALETELARLKSG
jgi:hypothetical protein